MFLHPFFFYSNLQNLNFRRVFDEKLASTLKPKLLVILTYVTVVAFQTTISISDIEKRYQYKR